MNPIDCQYESISSRPVQWFVMLVIDCCRYSHTLDRIDSGVKHDPLLLQYRQPRKNFIQCEAITLC